MCVCLPPHPRARADTQSNLRSKLGQGQSPPSPAPPNFSSKLMICIRIIETMMKKVVNSIFIDIKRSNQIQTHTNTARVTDLYPVVQCVLCVSSELV